jgi:hypothetical protein
VDKAELRRLASKRIPLTEEEWDFFVEREFVDDALTRLLDEEKVNFLIEEYYKHKVVFAEAGGRRRSRDQQRSEVPVSLRASEGERKAAFQEYAAKRASCDDGVRWFRGWVLGDRLLTAEQMRELVRSPAARFLEANKFEFAGGDIPLIGHRANLEYCLPLRRGGSEVGHCARVSVDAPGITETVENVFDEASRPAPKKRRFKDGTYGQALYYVNEGGRARKVSVWDWSLLGQLRAVSERLAQWYRWEPAQATMFVLTGAIPAVPALKVGTSVKSYQELHDAKRPTPEYIDVKIIIEASPWVTWKTVKKGYRKAQIKVMGTSGGTPPRSKNLKLFRFVTKRIGSTSTRMPNGKSLVSEWNEAHPQWAYKDSVGDLNTRQFWRDYHRMRKTIAVGPPYQLRNPAAADRQPRQTDGS